MSGAGLLLSHTTEGALAPGADAARWTPIVVVFTLPATMSAVVVAQIGDNSVLTMVAYSTELNGFQPLFQDKSTISVNGTTVTMSILPNGGWTRESVTIVPYVAWEAQP